MLGYSLNTNACIIIHEAAHKYLGIMGDIYGDDIRLSSRAATGERFAGKRRQPRMDRGFTGNGRREDAAAHRP